MYEPFINSNNPSAFREPDEKAEFINNFTPEIAALFSECGGTSFADGMYKVHTIASSLHWAFIISSYFDKYASQIIPISYDWMGRQFCVYPSSKEFVLLIDPSTGERIDIPRDIVVFHNELLVQDRKDVLAEDIFDAVRDLLQIREVKHTDCLGYKVPLYLRGSDSVDNYEVFDMEAYWETQKQLYFKIKNSSPGVKTEERRL